MGRTYEALERADNESWKKRQEASVGSEKTGIRLGQLVFNRFAQFRQRVKRYRRVEMVLDVIIHVGVKKTTQPVTAERPCAVDDGRRVLARS